MIALSFGGEGLDALDGDTFRLLDVAGWALLFAGMFVLFAVLEWLKPRWAESLAFGVGIATIGLTEATRSTGST